MRLTGQGSIEIKKWHDDDEDVEGTSISTIIQNELGTSFLVLNGMSHPNHRLTRGIDAYPNQDPSSKMSVDECWRRDHGRK